MTLVNSIDFRPDAYIRKHIPYQRQFNKDFGSSFPDQVKRIGLASLTFLSLFRPFRKTVSVLANTARSVTHLEDLKNSNANERGIHVLKTGVAIANLAAGIYCHSLGMLMTTGYDTAGSTLKLVSHISQGDYNSALTEGAQFFSNALYLGVLWSGSVPLLLLSSTMQVGRGLYTASDEFKNGRDLEGVLQIVATAVRATDIKSQVELFIPEEDLPRDSLL